MTNTITNVPRELLERCCKRMYDMMQGDLHEELHTLLSAPSPAGVDGLEVVAWRIGFPNNTGYKVYGQRQPWAYKQYGVPSVIVYEVQELCRHSEALAGYVVRDARITTQEAQIKALQSGENCWQSGYDEGRRMGGKHCTGTIDQLRAELAALNAKLDASKFCANVADDLRAELANQLEVKAFWIGRTRALEVELAAIKAQEPAIARFEKHAMKAKDCLSECDVVLLSSIRRLLAASTTPGDSQ